MTRVLVISMFTHAIKVKVRELSKKVNLSEVRLVAIKAMPYNLEGKLMGEQFDYAFIDKFYDMDEVNIIREHITGLQKNQIRRF